MRPAIRKPNIITKDYGLIGNDYIMTLCRIVPEKGIHYLLKAYKQIDTNKKLVIAGNSSNAANYMQLIEKLAAEDDRVIMTGLVTGDKLQELLSNAYLYVLPSDIEGMSISLLEAMSYGNACLVSDIEENTDVVDEYAAIFNKGSVEDLKDKLIRLLGDSNEVNKYKREASDFICNKYDWDVMTKDTISIYVS
jgi:glycosyltransferase involved in cell wall biosynthesis